MEIVSKESLIDLGLKPTISGLLGYATSRYIFNEGKEGVLILGRPVSMPVAFGSTMALSTLLSELSFHYVLGIERKSEKLEHMLLSPAISGLSLVTLGYLVSGDIVPSNAVVGFGIQSLANVSTDFIEKSLLSNE